MPPHPGLHHSPPARAPHSLRGGAVAKPGNQPRLTPRPQHELRRLLCLLILALVALVALTTAAHAAERQGLLCDASTPLALAGLDTESGRLLLAADSARGAGGWLIDVTPAIAEREAPGWHETALYYPQDDGPRPYAGSMGPGPVFALSPCGKSCLQAVRWDGGVWVPMGEPLIAPGGTTAHATYDTGGRPWIVLQASEPRSRGSVANEPAVRSWAFYLEGPDWVAAGSLVVLASAATEAVPAPRQTDAILSGTGLFRVGAAPSSWLLGLPKLPPERQGVVVPAEGGGAAYVAADGTLYLSADQGKTWTRTNWTPWGRTATRIWTPGQDYLVDLPAGDRRGPLPLVWFDRRREEQERIQLTEWTPAGDWRLLAELAPEVKTLNEEALTYSDFLVVRPGAWVLLSGCVNTANGPGLVLRTYSAALGLTRPRYLPLGPGRSSAPAGSDALPVASDPLAPLPD